jgi:outer membrane protein assembly factor BamA
VAYRAWSRGGALTAEGGDWRNRGFARVAGEAALGWTAADLATAGVLRVRGGSVFGAAPAQHHTFLGGAGTLPGHPYRAYAGRTFVLAEAEATRQFGHPWIAGRAFAAAGTARGLEDQVAHAWGVTEGEVRGSIGVGVALLHRILRIDAAWGFNGGGPALLFSIDPRFQPWM